MDRVFTKQERAALAFLLAAGFSGLLVQEIHRRAEPARIEPHPAEFRLRVNSASPEQLAALSGIGPVLAHRIAEDCRRRGPYLLLTDLRRVKGVTPKLLSRIEGLVRFD